MQEGPNVTGLNKLSLHIVLKVVLIRHKTWMKKIQDNQALPKHLGVEITRTSRRNSFHLAYWKLYFWLKYQDSKNESIQVYLLSGFIGEFI